jgi:UDP-3-O-[3-hydroxymyristoyl] glucosamine N-acyltransferase
MELTISQIAQLIGGEIKGNAQIKVSGLGKIQDAKNHEVTFLSNMKYEPFIYTTQAAAVIVNKDFVPKRELSCALILVDDAYTALSRLLEAHQQMLNKHKTGVEQPSYMASSANVGEGLYLGAFAYVGENVRIGKNVKIYPQTYIGDNTSIGDNTIIYAGVKIYAGTQIGSYCTIQAGAVIGSDGFGFAPQSDGTFKTVPQVGNVIIEDHVDIGANTTVDRATMGATVISSGVKLDNLIQVAHNVQIGKNTVIAALTGISGSVEIGENCMIAGQVGIAGHSKVADRTSVAAQSGITKTISQPGTTIQGSPAFEIRESFRCIAVYKKLPQLLKRVEQLEENIVLLKPQS